MCIFISIRRGGGDNSRMGGGWCDIEKIVIYYSDSPYKLIFCINMATVYAKTKNAKYAARTIYFNIIHISVPADRIVTSWLDMCYTMHHPELLSSLKY